MKLLTINQTAIFCLRKRFSAWLLGAVIVLFSSGASAQQAGLINASFTSLPNQGIEVRMEFDSVPQTPSSYMIESPPRLVIDIPQVTNNMNARTLNVNTGIVDTVNFAQSQQGLRVVSNLLASAQHEIRLEGQDIVLRVSDTASGSQTQVRAQSSRQPSPESSPAEAEAPVASEPPRQRSFGGQTRIESIDFQRIEGDKGRVVIQMNNDRASLNINREGGNVVAMLQDVSLSSDLAQRLDVQDFATPLQFIDSMSSSQGATILMRPTSDPFDYMAYQTGNQMIIDFTPITREEQKAERDNQFPFTGERIDLNFQNVEVRAVLQIIAEVAEMNLVVSDSVTGTTTLRLKNVPWDQALDILLKSKGLDKREMGNVLMVGTATEISDRERIEAESQQQVQELAPLLTEFIQVDFRRASDMRSRLEEARLITDRGFILADDQTNVLMVRETSRQMEEIRRTLRRFDVEVAQVLVEARLVTASTEFARELGVRWGAAGSANNRVSIGGGSGTVPGIPGIDGSGMGASLVSGQPSVPGMVDLSVGNATSAIRVGYLSSGLLLSAELSALQSDNKIEIVSQPKVITTNGRPAVIKSGQEVAFQTVENGEVSLEFKEVVLSLEVTPQINPGDRISMDLKILQDSLDPNRLGGELLINTNQLETSVVVNDGDTIVLGGVFRNDIENAIRKTPVLGDLPVLGGLFRHRTEKETKRELLIFITPTMIRESLAIQ